MTNREFKPGELPIKALLGKQDPKDMTDQQLNLALAELMGYTVSKSGYIERWKGVAVRVQKVPDYCTDPAASLEVQTAAIAEDPEEYIRNLSIVQCGPDSRIQHMAGVNLKGAAKMCDATPRQRAEAAYLTLRGKE